MFCDNTSFDSPTREPVAVALTRPHPIDTRLQKSNSTKVSKLPNIMNHNQAMLSYALSPNNISSRPDNLYPAADKSTPYPEDSVSMRGPKVISRNLPEVFVSGNLSAHKVRKVSGLKRRSRLADLERDSFTGVSAQVVLTEPDGDAKCYGSPGNIAPVGYSYRALEQKHKAAYDSFSQLKAPAHLKDLSERLSTGGSPLRFGHDNHSENRTPIHISHPMGDFAEKLKNIRHSQARAETSVDANNSMSPRSDMRRNSNFSNFISKMGGKNSLYLDTKLPYNSNLGYPRSATNQKAPQINLEVEKRPSISYKNDLLLAESKENFQISLKNRAQSRCETRDSVTPYSASANNISGFINGYSNNGINAGGVSQFKPKSEENNKQLKKLFVFKKMPMKIPSSGAIEATNANINNNTEEVRVKVIDRVIKPNLMPSIRLNQLITLKKICTTINRGTLKRMLHAPTFKIYDIQEEPISELSSKETLHIKERLNELRSHFFNSHHLVRVFSCFWNSPEGCVSILLEPSKSDFLDELISHFGSAPERCLQPLAQDLLLGINEIHQKLRKPHGYISTNEVYTDLQGRFKLGPGASQAFAQAFQQHKAIHYNEEGIINTVQKGIGSQSESRHTTTPPAHKESLAQDIFDFGFTLLQCAVGDFSMYDLTGQITLENLKIMLNSKALKKYAQNSCCLLHSEEFVRRIIGSINTPNDSATLKKKIMTNSFMVRSPRNGDKKARESIQMSSHIPLIEVLTAGNRFSEDFVDFLCNCLKLDEHQRMGATDLLNHNFLGENHICKGPVVSVKEFMRLRSKENDIIKVGAEKISSEHLEKFSEALGVVFLNRDVKEKCEGLLNKEVTSKFDDKKIVDLADELEVSPRRLWNRLKYVVNN